MALTERYVTQAAAGGGSGTSGSPWTFAEAITHSLTNTGQRYNVLSDGTYSIGTTTFGAGTFQLPNIWRGYDSTIGDCDNLGRNADGTLNTTGMPAITITGVWTMAFYTYLQNLNITGALSSQLIGDTTVDAWGMISCRVENTQNNASASCVHGDDQLQLENSDIIGSGASHSRLVFGDVGVEICGCRIETTASANAIEVQSTVKVVDCVLIKRGSQGGAGVQIDLAIQSTAKPLISGVTFYNFTSAIESTTTHSGGWIWIRKCHFTDCGKTINNTTNIATFFANSRTRDNTNPPSTVELISIGEITTDTGGSSTDYLNSGSGDLHLITTAAGYNAGWDGSDLGGLQTDPPSSSGGAVCPIISAAGGGIIRGVSA